MTGSKILSQSANLALKVFMSSCIYQRVEVTVAERESSIAEEKPQIYSIVDEEAHSSFVVSHTLLFLPPSPSVFCFLFFFNSTGRLLEDSNLSSFCTVECSDIKGVSS